MKPDSSYRNLALHRPAWHSSAYDYNLTAQLVTDGIKDTAMPRWVSTSTSQQGVLPRNEREWLLDSNWVSTVRLKGSTGWVQVELWAATSRSRSTRFMWTRPSLPTPGPRTGR